MVLGRASSLVKLNPTLLGSLWDISKLLLTIGTVTFLLARQPHKTL
jgi:hypothetical protein